MASGYTDCRCRDCFEIAIADDVRAGAFCAGCAEAGCTTDGECQAPGAYGADEEEEE